MKHYVLIFVFDEEEENVLLIEKIKPSFQKGRWNGVGGKIEDGELPIVAARRELMEETGIGGGLLHHAITVICEGGTLFVFHAKREMLSFEQKEEEILAIWPIKALPSKNKLMNNIRWMIPLCLSNYADPIMVRQLGFGVER